MLGLYSASSLHSTAEDEPPLAQSDDVPVVTIATAVAATFVLIILTAVAVFVICFIWRLDSSSQLQSAVLAYAVLVLTSTHSNSLYADVQITLLCLIWHCMSLDTQ